MMSTTGTFDVEAYLARTGAAVSGKADLATLRVLHAAHLAAIPFENIDVRLRRPIKLDLASLQEKLVRSRRGGYCFEQNTLFAAALTALGYHVQTLEARVRPPGATAPLARTHMTLRVDIDGRAWLADVGFGGDGPLQPVPLDGAIEEQPGADFCVFRESFDLYVLRVRFAQEWQDLYAFTLTPALPIDFEIANYFTSTHPGSSFVNRLTVQLTLPRVRHILRGQTYTVRRGAEVQTIQLDEAEVAHLLSEVFRLDVGDASQLVNQRPL